MLGCAVEGPNKGTAGLQWPHTHTAHLWPVQDAVASYLHVLAVMFVTYITCHVTMSEPLARTPCGASLGVTTSGEVRPGCSQQWVCASLHAQHVLQAHGLCQAPCHGLGPVLHCLMPSYLTQPLLTPNLLPPPAGSPVLCGGVHTAAHAPPRLHAPCAPARARAPREAGRRRRPRVASEQSPLQRQLRSV